MDNNYKIVDFHVYCPSCKYKELKGDEEPCNECLTESINLNSKKPVKYKEKDSDIK